MPPRRSNWIWERSIRWQLIAGVAVLQIFLMTCFVAGLIRWQEHSLRAVSPAQSQQQPDANDHGSITVQELAVAGLLYTLVSAGAGTLFAWLLARAILSPLRLLQQGVERFGAEVLDQPIPITGANEVAIVSRAFNDAMHRLAHQQKQLRDEIAERERAERQLSDLYRDAEESNRAKDHFLAVLSHELRSPLTPALMLTQMLERDDSLPELAREDIAVIRRNVEAEVRLIDDLMDLTRIKRNKVEMRIENVMVHEKLRELVRLNQVEADAKKIELCLELWADQAMVRGDEGRLGQVFSNLLQNAIKFTPAGGRIAIQTHREPHVILQDSSEPGAEANTATEESDLLIEFCDSGIGIEPAMLVRIFDEFEQGSREANRVFGGLGLGLTISRALVQLHEGQLTVRSDGRDRGSTFTVRLPMSTASVRRGALEVKTTKPVPLAAAHSSRRILLVEDHPPTCRATALLLRKCGYDVQTAETVAMAIKLARNGHFDLIVSDVGLPDGTGHQLIRQLVAEAPSHEMKGIAISGRSGEEDLRKSHEAGFIDHIVKPINPETLIHSVEEAIGKGKED
jgi:signal transduction histidine kinase/ActR/RegA family two-component response regulator